MKAFFSKVWTWALAHKVIAIALAGVLVVGVTCAIVLPIALHEHSYATEWSADAENHWHAGTCHEEEQGDLGAHRYLNACDTTCNVCSATRTVGAHVFSNACDASCNLCGATRTASAHVYDNACDTACNVCGEPREITHAHGTTLTAGDTTHYYLCSVCGDKKDETAHVFDKTVASSEYLKAAATATTKTQYWKSCVCGAKSATEYFESDKTVATVTGIQDLSKTFNGTAVAAPTFTTNSDGVAVIEWYLGDTKLDAAPTNAGTYKVKIVVPETVTFAGVVGEKEFTVAKKAATFTVAPSMSSVTIKYSENYSVNYTTDGDGVVTVEYKVRGAEDATYTTVAPTVKGLYTARVTVAEGANYLAVSATVDFEIEAFVFSSLSTNVVYNGTDTHEIDMAPYGHSGVTLRVTFINNGNVGAYPNGVTVLENDEPTANYLVDVATCTVNIVAKTVSVSWTAPANLAYDGTEKLPVATLTGVLAGDDCTAMIELADGENVWFDGTFKYRVMSLMGADADNYELPLNGNGCTSPEYTVTIDTVAVGSAADVGAAALYNGTLYYKLALESGYYYFDFSAATQGATFDFALYQKGEQAIAVQTFAVGDVDEKSAVFYIEDAGDYYVKCTTPDETQGDTLTVQADTHTEADAFGFCRKGCGTYLGEDLTTNMNTSAQLSAQQSVFYRFANDDEDASVKFNIKYNGAHDGVSVSCYAPLANGDFVLQPLNETAQTLTNVPEDGYYYLVISATSDVTLEFAIEQTY